MFNGIGAMLSCQLPFHTLLFCVLLSGFSGCASETPAHPLDEDLARTSVQKAMDAWVRGAAPKDLEPEIIVGDPAWKQNKKLVSFEILTNEETSDGSNLHIRVNRKFDTGDAKVTYIVGTSPVITIFPQ